MTFSKEVVKNCKELVIEKFIIEKQMKEVELYINPCTIQNKVKGT